MRNLITAIFLFSSFCTTAQITGMVKNRSNEPVEFATIFNIKTKESSISNKDGVFHLDAEVDDSIQIQHLNYTTRSFAVRKLNDNYTLYEKNYNLGEVVVSANYAARMFELSCEKTYNKLKDKNVSRGYLRDITIRNADTIQLIDIDMDIIQKKQKSFDKKDQILPYIMQQRIVENVPDSEKIRIRHKIFPELYSIKWDKFANYFNYFEVQDSQFIKLYFLNKKSFHDSITHVEVVIQKSDSCLYSLSSVSKKLFKTRKGVPLQMDTKLFTFIKYAYVNDFSYISERKTGAILTNSVFGRKDMAMFTYFKTYNNGASNLELRPKGHRIFRNELEPRLIKNKFDEEFWESDNYLDFEPYDFEYLLNLDLGNN